MNEDVIKWKHFPCFWPFVKGIHRWPVDSPNKDQGRGALMFSLICAWANDWANDRYASDLRRHCAHYDVTVMCHQEARLASYDIEALLSSHFPSQYLRNPYISATLIRNSYVIDMLLLCDVSWSTLSARCYTQINGIFARKITRVRIIAP